MRTLRLLVLSIVVILVSCGKDQEIASLQSLEREVKININLNLDFDVKLSGSDSKSGPNPGYNTEESFSEFDHVFADEIDLVFRSTTSDYTNTLTFNPNDLSTAPTLIIPYGSYTWSIEDNTPENPTVDYILRDYLPVFATGTLEIASSSVVLDLKVDTDFGLVTVEKAHIDSAKLINSDQYEKQMVERGDYLYLYVYASAENEMEIKENIYNSVVIQSVDDTGIVEAKTHYNYFLAVSEVGINSISLESGPFKFKENSINIGINFANELIAWYPLNGNALDYSENNYSGSVFGASPAVDRNGAQGNSLDFNVSEEDYLKVDATLDQVNEEFTFSFWVNPELEVDLSTQEGENITATPKNFPQPVLHPTHGQNFGDETLHAGTGIFVGTNGIIVQEHSHNYVVNRIMLPITIDDWTNITVTYNNNAPSLYVNGLLLKEVSSGARKVFCSIGSDFTNRADYSKSGIGSSYAPAYANYFEGQIDNFGIWNRVLNQDEIKTLARTDFELNEYLGISNPTDPQATCDDGIQNGDETGVDCGGSCSVCEDPSAMLPPDLNEGTIDMEESGMGPDLSDDNESNGDNPSGTWGVFGSDENNKIQLEIVDNPNTTGNTSAKVLKIVEQGNQAVWQGFFFNLDNKILFSDTHTAISVDVHSTREGQMVTMKLEDKLNSSLNSGDVKVATKGTGWETLTFNFSVDHSGLFDNMIFIMDFGDAAETEETNHYIDNIRLSSPSVNTSGTFSPNFDGPFGGATIEEGGIYTFPGSAENWAGWANNNTDIYPLGFPNGGTITFTASSASEAGIYFRFERLPYDENDSNATEPSFNTETITINGETATEYTVTIEAQDAANTYSSVQMYLTTRDVPVTITDIKINL